MLRVTRPKAQNIVQTCLCLLSISFWYWSFASVSWSMYICISCLQTMSAVSICDNCLVDCSDWLSKSFNLLLSCPSRSSNACRRRKHKNDGQTATELMIHSVTNWLVDWLTDWFTKWLTNSLNDLLIARFTNSLIDWLIYWMNRELTTIFCLSLTSLDCSSCCSSSLMDCCWLSSSCLHVITAVSFCCISDDSWSNLACSCNKTHITPFVNRFEALF